MQSPTPETGPRTPRRDSAAQEYRVKRLLANVIDAIIVYAVIGLITAATFLPAFLTGVFVPGSSPQVPFIGGFMDTVELDLGHPFRLGRGDLRQDHREGILELRVATDIGRPTLGVLLPAELGKISRVLLILDVMLGLNWRQDTRRSTATGS
jgi:hypothetical protein